MSTKSYQINIFRTRQTGFIIYYCTCTFGVPASFRVSEHGLDILGHWQPWTNITFYKNKLRIAKRVEQNLFSKVGAVLSFLEIILLNKYFNLL